MAFKRLAILTLAGLALAQMDGMGGSGSDMESSMPISSSSAAASPVATELAQSTTTSTPYINSSALIITNSSLSPTGGDYSSTTTTEAESTASLPVDPMSTTSSNMPGMSDPMMTATDLTTMSTSVTSMDMSMGTGGTSHGNASATGTVPISGGGISGASIGLFVASTLLGALVLL
ncbi:hypothetical protein SUNI508_03222 [Seiridium unicorne]|uniref:Uncharacterized protein n=1 Tax=Seiridium unicorne TaxID=138068 RepID=A0ABR2VDV6_9PEZI